MSSVTNALRLLKVFSDQESEIGISDLARRVGLAKSTVHRLASSLVEEGMLEQAEREGKYRLGLALFELGALVRRKMDVTAEARHHLKALSERSGETVQLAVLEQTAALYINVIESQRALRMSYQVGTRAPLHCTAVGKVLLAHADDKVFESTVAQGLAALTAMTITQASELRRDLSAVVQRGYAFEEEEAEPGLRGVAAPVRDFSGQVVAAIGISGPTHRMSKKVLQIHARDLLAVSGTISQRLGYQAPLLARRA
ncbi:MAG: IclR family transcriptional regulator [Betaproteobacteria bacterium]|nr:IclR family transcriptional regulator [Betaproteobacteria bacterium]